MIVSIQLVIFETKLILLSSLMIKRNNIPALSNGNDITSLDAHKGGGAVSSNVLVALLITVVLWNKVEVIATQNDGALHLGADHSACKNATADGDVASERALLVNVSTSDGLLGSLETKTHALVPALALLLWHHTLVVEEHCILLLEATLILIN